MLTFSITFHYFFVTLQAVTIIKHTIMFSKETYIRRRAELKKLVGKGIVILFGNNDAPANYPANAYAPMRQDSSFLYYFGQHRDGSWASSTSTMTKSGS